MLIAITLHTWKTTCVFTGPLCLAFIGITVSLKHRKGTTASPAVQIVQNGSLTVKATEEASCFYYIVNGKATRVALASKTLHLLARKVLDVPSAQVFGPFQLANPVYTSWPEHLTVLCTDCGIFEGLDLVMSRKKSSCCKETNLYWFTGGNTDDGILQAARERCFTDTGKDSLCYLYPLEYQSEVLSLLKQRKTAVLIVGECARSELKE